MRLFSVGGRDARRILTTNFFNVFIFTNWIQISNAFDWRVLQIKMYFYLHTRVFLFIYSFTLIYIPNYIYVFVYVFQIVISFDYAHTRQIFLGIP